MYSSSSFSSSCRGREGASLAFDDCIQDDTRSSVKAMDISICACRVSASMSSSSGPAMVTEDCAAALQNDCHGLLGGARDERLRLHVIWADLLALRELLASLDTTAALVFSNFLSQSTLR